MSTQHWRSVSPDTSSWQLGLGLESLLLQQGKRGMEQVAATLEPGYLARSLNYLVHAQGEVWLLSGFPVGDTFENDGPLGALALARALLAAKRPCRLLCSRPLFAYMQELLPCTEFPIMGREASQALAMQLLTTHSPALLLAIERVGMAADGHYYSMRGQCLSGRVAELDWLVRGAGCPVIAIGDGGNEIGMGKVNQALASLPITPCVTGCTELIPATVSNWAGYVLAAWLMALQGRFLHEVFDLQQEAQRMQQAGAVDGLTGQAELSEDGFALQQGLALVEQVEQLLGQHYVLS